MKEKKIKIVLDSLASNGIKNVQKFFKTRSETRQRNRKMCLEI